MSQRVPAWKRLGLQLKNVSNTVDSSPQNGKPDPGPSLGHIISGQLDKQSIVTVSRPKAVAVPDSADQKDDLTQQNKKRSRDTNGVANSDKKTKRRRKDEENGPSLQASSETVDAVTEGAKTSITSTEV